MRRLLPLVLLPLLVACAPSPAPTAIPTVAPATNTPTFTARIVRPPTPDYALTENAATAVAVALGPPTATATIPPTITPTPTINIAPTQTRAAELAQIATLTAPTAMPTVTPPQPTRGPIVQTGPPRTVAPTIAPTPTLNARQLDSCKQINAYYDNSGRYFDRIGALRNPELAFLDLRLVTVGTTDRPLNRLAQFRYDLDRALLWDCLGLPPPPRTFPPLSP